MLAAPNTVTNRITASADEYPVCHFSNAARFRVMDASSVTDPGPLLEVLDRHAAAGLGLWLDVANLHQVGHATPDAVAALAPHVEYVHVKDYRTGPDGWRAFCPAGTGEVPYHLVLPLLHAARPALPYALETHVRDTPAAALRAGASFLRAAVPGGVA